MSNVYTKDINVPKTARNKRIYSGNYTIRNSATSNTTITDMGGTTITQVELITVTKQVYHGFESVDASTLSLDEALRLVTITGTDFKVWNKGQALYRDTESIEIADTDGDWYIYYDDQNQLTASQTEWDNEIDQPIAIVTWNATANTGVLYDERRSCYDTNHVRLLKQNQKAHQAGDIWVDTTNFDNNLTAADDTVQKALETLDDLLQVQSDWDQADTDAIDFIKNKPTIPDAQIQSDWDQATNTEPDYIKNKPTIPDAQIQSDWLQVTDTELDYIKNKPEIPGGPAAYYPDGLISGGLVTWISGYTYLVSAAVYRIGGVVYYSDSMNVTLDASDTTYDRRDLIVVTTGSIASFVKGTAAADPVKPQVDPATELELTDVFLLANSSDPTGGTTITDEIIYNENTEWSHSVSGVTVNFDSNTSPFIGSKCADVGLISNNDTITFTSGSVLNFADYETFLLNVKLKETLPGSCSLWVEFLLSGTSCSNPIQLFYNRAYANVWQGLILHMQTWIQYTTTFDGVRIKWRKTGPDNNSLGLYLDYIKLQAGIPQPTTSGEISLIGDITGSGEIGTDIYTTLKTVNSNVGSFGSTTKTVTATVDAKGRITAISENTIPLHDAVTIASGSSGYASLSGQELTIAKQTETDIDINMSGFLNQTETTIAFDGTNLFTLGSVGATWHYYRAGLKYTITGSKTVTLPGSPVTTGTYYIYIDANDGSLTQSTSVWTLLDNKIPVAVILFNNSLTPKYHLCDERHTILIHRREHYMHHATEGSKMASMGALSGYTLNSDVNANKTFKIADSVMLDEDIIHSESELTQPNGTATAYTVFYRTASTTWNWKKSNMPFVYNVGNTNDWIQYDSNGTMTDATGGTGSNTRWVNSFLAVTNIEGDGRFVIIPGRALHTSLAAAQAEAVPGFAGIGITEGVVTYRLTWSTTTSTSQGKCILAEVKAINTPILNNPVSGASIDHNTLAGLQGGSDTERYHITAAEKTLYDSFVYEDISFEFCDVTKGTAQSWTLDIKASFAYNIINASLETDNGTLTGCAVKIGTTAVTSLSSVSVDTAVDTTTATGANSVAVGDRVYLHTSTGYTGTPTLIRGKLKIQRT